MHTKIKNDYEPQRIFNPMLNILAYNAKKKGTVQGRITKNEIEFEKLLYNTLNFRDKSTGKPKDISRKKFEEQQKNKKTDGIKITFEDAEKWNKEVTIKKAKQLVKTRVTESKKPTEMLSEDFTIALCPQIHHIFPKSKFANIDSIIENLIGLTPTQHYNFAHPNNYTKEINVEYQKECLLRKIDIVVESMNKKEEFYLYERLLFVIEIGLGTTKFKGFKIEEKDKLKEAITEHYRTL